MADSFCDTQSSAYFCIAESLPATGNPKTIKGADESSITRVETFGMKPPPLFLLIQTEHLSPLRCRPIAFRKCSSAAKAIETEFSGPIMHPSSAYQTSILSSGNLSRAARNAASRANANNTGPTGLPC